MIKASERYPPLRCLAIANSGQGKTTYISSFVMGRLGKQWSPKRVIVISKTYKADLSIKPLLEACSKKKKDFE